MSRAHSRTIIDKVITALRAIHTDSGDSFVPSIVQRHDEDRSVEAAPYSILVRKVSNPRVRNDGSLWVTNLGLEILCNVYSGEELLSASDELIEEAEEDVFRALAYVVDWDTLNAELRSFVPETFREEHADIAIAGFMATIDVEYRVAYDNPNTILTL